MFARSAARYSAVVRYRKGAARSAVSQSFQTSLSDKRCIALSSKIEHTHNRAYFTYQKRFKLVLDYVFNYRWTDFPVKTLSHAQKAVEIAIRVVVNLPLKTESAHIERKIVSNLAAFLLHHRSSI